ncbi:hypothetical protein DIX59_10060 [Streptococcus iniae]|uniref:hypothetical protein n=1 Tax=Streptococcus iniae TaxID=1346 RepID=UPI00035C8560|nr:hypothetical protein [Streptococcus iniae]ESR10548.1 hypothetical protein IUSA1_01310 [Streptococcus iniae IUSA1]KYJ81226.1 hypothetical protein NA30_04305 [Streptococcus iniae]RMI72633.1 hypothetical protein DIX59_10060 [Streptococcus iniae]HEK4517253.1 hypothetical protein [Streptococcus iniae]
MAQTHEVEQKKLMYNLWCHVRDGFLMVGYYTVVALKYIIITPFFIFSALKNWFFTALSVTVLYLVLGMIYFAFTNQHHIIMNPDLLLSKLFTDISFWIVVAISGISALILTVGQYRGDID